MNTTAVRLLHRLFQMLFDAAVESAETLGIDADKVSRWRSAEALLPDYPRYEDEPSSSTSPALPPSPTTSGTHDTVFPADQIGWFSRVQDIFRRTAAVCNRSSNAPIMLAAARARLGMPDTHEWLCTELLWRERPNGTLSFNRLDPRFGFNDYGHYTEMFGVCLPINELLFQSVGDVIRLFPAWPGHLAARIVDLRTQGGFLVSAAFSGGQTRDLTVESTAGGPLRLLAPWPKTEVLTDTGWTSCSQTTGHRPYRHRARTDPPLSSPPGLVASSRPGNGAVLPLRRRRGGDAHRSAPGVSTGYQMPGPGGAAVTRSSGK